FRAEPYIAPYCASKFAVIGFSQSLAYEVGQAGVRVNCVCPGAIDSPMNSELAQSVEAISGSVSGDVTAALVASTALRRLGEPMDVGLVTVFLASDLARFVTGQAVVADGGLVT